MPIVSSALVSGRYTFDVLLHAGFGSGDVLTGGPAGTTMSVAPSMVSAEYKDSYRYRNMEIDARVSFEPDIRDSKGRMKWEVDGDEKD
jgi:hypothetical protein